MKKLLALVLALVMVLGLATVSTSAAYSDANDIDYSEAVDVMTAVGVFQGKGNAFAPKDGLNRAEAAKLIAYLMLGNKTAESMKGSGAKFADVPASHWASGYIEYLATAGVVSGVGGGNFDPNGKVTAVAFAKMLLVALGYDAEIEGFTGNSSWAINIQKLANDNDLYDLLDVASTATLTREQAAQMCLNDLKATMVEYESKGTTVQVGDAKVTTDAKKAEDKTSTATKARAIKDDYALARGYDFYLQLGEDLYSGDLKMEGTNDDLGRPSNKWTYKNVDVGTYANKSDLLFSTNEAVKKTKVYDIIGKDAYDSLKKANGNDIEVYVDGVKQTVTLANYVDKDNTGDLDGSGRAVLTEIYKTENYDGNKNDLYTFTLTRTHLVQAAADYSTTGKSVKVTFITDNGDTRPTGFPSEIKQEDFDVSGVKEDDYLLVTWSGKDKSIQTVAPATMVEGKVTSYVLESSVTLDGNKYQYAKVVDKNTDMGKSIEFNIGSTAKLVTDGQFILAVDDADADASYLYVQAAGMTNTNNKVVADVYFTDGTSKANVVVKKASFLTNKTNAASVIADYTNFDGDSTTATTAPYYAGLLEGQWYTYTTNDSGEYTLKVIGSSTTPAYKNTNNTLIYNADYDGAVQFLYSDKVSFITKDDGTALSAKANNDTKVYVLDDDNDITVYEGSKNLPDISITTASFTAGKVKVSAVVDGSYAKYVFVDVSKVKTTIDDSTESDDYMFLLKEGDDHTDDKNDNNYTDWTALVKGEEATVKIEKGATPSNAGAFATGVLYNKVKTNSKGYITSAKVIDYGTNSNKMVNETAQRYVKESGIYTDKITYKNGTLGIGENSFKINSGASLNLIYKGQKAIKDAGESYSMSALLDDANLKYDASNIKTSGSGIVGQLKNLSGYRYDYYAVCSDDVENNEGKLDVLYIWLYDATEDAAAEEVALSTDVVYVGMDTSDDHDGSTKEKANIVYYYSEAGGTRGTSNAEKKALLLNGAKYDNATFSGGTWTLNEEDVVYIKFVQVYKVTLGATTYYAPKDADLANAWNATTNIILTKTGAYATGYTAPTYTYVKTGEAEWTDVDTAFAVATSDITFAAADLGYFKIGANAVTLDTNYPYAGWSVTTNTTEQYIKADKNVTIVFKQNTAADLAADTLNTALGTITLKTPVAGVSVGAHTVTAGTTEDRATVTVTLSFDVSEMTGNIAASSVTLAKAT